MTRLSYFNNNEENLTILAEECAELVQIICKIKRHGMESYNPDTNESNRELLIQEMGDVYAFLKVTQNMNMITNKQIVGAAKRKLDRTSEYYHRNVDGEISSEICDEF